METAIAKSVEQLSSRVLDSGQVKLLNHMGGDLAVVAAARVSNGESYYEASHGIEKDSKLIRYLVKHRHGTPFEHSTFQFYVKAPLFVRSEWHRHRMASYNEISGRYVTYNDEFYIPARFRVQSSDNKQGSFYPDDEWFHNKAKDADVWKFGGPHDLEEWDEQIGHWISEFTNQAYAMYLNLLSWGVAKEMARIILPANKYTEFYVTLNARSLMNFLSLRCAEDAQWEIRQYALAMRDMFKVVMPLTYRAWEDNGYIAP